MNATLSSICGTDEFKLNNVFTNRIGSAPGNEVPLAGSEPRHAGIRRLEKDVWALFNLSNSGTSVRHKGIAISDFSYLKNGDKVTICGTKFVFNIVD